MNGIQVTAAVAAAMWAPVAFSRWRAGKLSTERKIISVVGVLGLALYAAGAFEGLPQPEKVLEDVSGALGKWTYLLVTVLAFLETGAFIGLVAPGEAAVIVGGVVAGQGEIDIRLLIGLVWFAAFAGDSVSFYLGHRLGREFLVRHGPRFQITEPRLEQVEKYMRVHGGKTILVGRFIGLVRALAPFVAGSSKMSYRSFMPYDIVGSGLWAAFFCLLGYIFSNNLSEVIHWAERGVLIFGWVVGTIVLIVYLVRRFRKPEERAKLTEWLDEQERDHPRRAIVLSPVRKAWDKVVFPVFRFFGPQLRFAWERFTPGGLGLEFTTLMAVLMAAGYTLYFFTIAAIDWPTEFTTKINDAAFRVADSIRTDWLDTLAEWITHLGAFPVAAFFTLIAAGYCLYRRRVPEALVLIFSLAIAGLLVSPIKEWTEVPRPPGSLVETMGYAYPSGHTAYAITYVTIAVTLERVRDIVTRAALVVVAIALASAIGLSRVYLRAHYLSDVIGGAALTATITALLASLALLILHIRKLRAGANAAETAPATDIVA
ncbi:MAG: bifunctional DedA family/phosphatase PAP2 family protein [Thermoleophilaceae bacterium]|nr:bifunctional DedA family/phosphatase PAP2 family protein [Thermoleophilaceae bacterium]